MNNVLGFDMLQELIQFNSIGLFDICTKETLVYDISSQHNNIHIIQRCRILYNFAGDIKWVKQYDPLS